MAPTVTVLSAASLAASGLLRSHGEKRQGSEEKGQQGVAFDSAVNPASLSHLTLVSKACWGGLFQGKPEDSH